MTPVFADTFFFLALLNEKDAGHGVAQTFAATSNRPIVTTAWVLTEVGDGCATGGKRAAFLQLLSLLRAAPDVSIVPPSEETFEKGLELFARRPDKEWSLTDCISFVVMADFGLADALTGDHHFEQAGFKLLLKPAN